MQELFLHWIAYRLGLTFQESVDRYGQSWMVYPHNEQEFRDFIQHYQMITSVFADDSEKESLEAYRICQYVHFLRWLAGNEFQLPLDPDDFPQDNVIVDYGAGVPHHSVQFALALANAGKNVRLYIVDIRTIISEFVAYAVQQLKISTGFIWVDEVNRYPKLPKHNICFAIDSIEHLHDPDRAIANIDEALIPGGLFVANLTDHQEEYFHVSPNLERVRNGLIEKRYSPEYNGNYYRKPNGN